MIPRDGIRWATRDAPRPACAEPLFVGEAERVETAAQRRAVVGVPHPFACPHLDPFATLSR